MKTSSFNFSVREHNTAKLLECEESAFDVKRSASGKIELNEPEYIIIEKDLNESADNNNNKIFNNNPAMETASNPTPFRKLLEILGTEIELYKCFRLNEDQSVFLFFN